MQNEVISKFAAMGVHSWPWISSRRWVFLFRRSEAWHGPLTCPVVILVTTLDRRIIGDAVEQLYKSSMRESATKDVTWWTMCYKCVRSNIGIITFSSHFDLNRNWSRHTNARPRFWVQVWATGRWRDARLSATSTCSPTWRFCVKVWWVIIPWILYTYNLMNSYALRKRYVDKNATVAI